MVTRVIFGNISQERQEDWNKKDENPYAVVDEIYEVPEARTEILEYGKKHFSEPISIDWGSCAWKCTYDEFVAYLKHYKFKIPAEIENIDKDETYGIVFIEEVGYNDVYGD